MPQITKETVEAVTAEEIDVVKDACQLLEELVDIEFDPTGTLEADQRAKYGGQHRRVQHCATGAIFGKDL